MPSFLELVGGLLFAVVFFSAYFLPTIIAYARGDPTRSFIFVMNGFFGASGVGWVIMLIVSLRPEEPAAEPSEFRFDVKITHRDLPPEGGSRRD